MISKTSKRTNKKGESGNTDTKITAAIAHRTCKKINVKTCSQDNKGAQRPVFNRNTQQHLGSTQ